MQVGETLTEGTSGISDGNGITNVQCTYQWLHSVDGTYTPTGAYAGNAFKVRVSFAAAAGHSETLTSAARDILLVAEEQGATSSVSEPEVQDFPADTTTTGTICGGDSVRGEVGFEKDVAWWEVELSAGKAYSFDLIKEGLRRHRDALEPIPARPLRLGRRPIPSTVDDDHGLFPESYFHLKIDDFGTYYIAAGAVHTGNHSWHPNYNTIVDPDESDPIGLVAGGGHTTVREGAGTYDFIVKWDPKVEFTFVLGALAGGRGANRATENGDLEQIGHDVKYEPGDTEKHILLTILDDDLSEGDETLSINLLRNNADPTRSS